MGRESGCHDVALRLLARRELTTSQLRQRLLQCGLPADEIDHTLDRLTRAGLLDDARTALARARRAVQVKLRGRHRARRELEALGIDPPVAERALAMVFDEVDEAAVLERAIARRVRGPVRTRADLRRLHQALVRQGFARDQVTAALLARAGADAALVEE